MILHELKWEILPHPPYSPDLAPSNFFLFPKLKEQIKGTHWSSISDVEHAVKQWLSDQCQDFYRGGLERCRYHVEKYIELDGNYVEK